MPNNSQAFQGAEQVLRLPAVKQRTGLSTASLYRLVVTGEFPKPIAISANARGWLASEISEWIERRRVARDSGADAALRTLNGRAVPPPVKRRTSQRIGASTAA